MDCLYQIRKVQVLFEEERKVASLKLVYTDDLC